MPIFVLGHNDDWVDTSVTLFCF